MSFNIKLLKLYQNIF